LIKIEALVGRDHTGFAGVEVITANHVLTYYCRLLFHIPCHLPQVQCKFLLNRLDWEQDDQLIRQSGRRSVAMEGINPMLEHQTTITQEQEDWFDRGKQDAWLRRPKHPPEDPQAASLYDLGFNEGHTRRSPTLMG